MMSDPERLQQFTHPRPRLLVVEDEAMLRRMLDRVLTAKGYEVRTADNGFDALVVLRAEAFDVVLSDMLMPLCDGRCLLQAMRDEGISVPVVVLTGYADATDGSLHALGAVAVLGKPAPVETIHATLASVIRT